MWLLLAIVRSAFSAATVAALADTAATTDAPPVIVPANVRTRTHFLAWSVRCRFYYVPADVLLSTRIVSTDALPYHAVLFFAAFFAFCFHFLLYRVFHMDFSAMSPRLHENGPLTSSSE